MDWVWIVFVSIVLLNIIFFGALYIKFLIDRERRRK